MDAEDKLYVDHADVASYKAGYRAGQESMRRRAVEVCRPVDQFDHGVLACAQDIEALEIEELERDSKPPR